MSENKTKTRHARSLNWKNIADLFSLMLYISVEDLGTTSLDDF